MFTKIRQLCVTTCTIAVDTISFGGNISASTNVTTVDFSGRTGGAIDIFTDADLTNASFTATRADLFDFNDGTVNIVANNLAVDVHYDDGAGNIGETGFFVPTDPKTVAQ